MPSAGHLVVGGAIPSTSAVSGVAGDEPWTKSGEVDSFDLGFDPPRVTDAWAMPLFSLGVSLISTN